MEIEQKILPVVCLVMIDKKGSIFAAQRPPEKKLGRHWEFPGGKIEPGEGPESALRREIREELQLNVGSLETLPETCHTYDFADIRLIPYLYRCTNRPAVTLSEHIDFCWIEPPTLLIYNWAPADLPIVRYLINDGYLHE